jgi:hypothetical protein
MVALVPNLLACAEIESEPKADPTRSPLSSSAHYRILWPAGTIGLRKGANFGAESQTGQRVRRTIGAEWLRATLYRDGRFGSGPVNRKRRRSASARVVTL